MAGGAFRRYAATRPNSSGSGRIRRTAAAAWPAACWPSWRRGSRARLPAVYLTTGPRQPEARHLYLNTGYEAQFDLAADPETIGPLAFTKDLAGREGPENPNAGSLSARPRPRDGRQVTPRWGEG